MDIKKTADIVVLSPDRWKEYQALRLKALQEDPTVFSNSYEEDAARPESEWRERLERAQAQEQFLFFAQVDGTLVGMIGAILDQGANVCHRATIISVYVDSEYRRYGIGKLLLGHIMHVLRRDPRVYLVQLRVNTQANAAVAFYKRFGFKEIGLKEKSLFVDGAFYDQYFMTKVLNKPDISSVH